MLEVVRNLALSICFVGIFVCFVRLIMCVYMLIKCNRTYKCRTIINNAICYYFEDQIKNGAYIVEDMKSTFDSLESFDDTLNRWWDWGLSRIAPLDVMDKIGRFLYIAKFEVDNKGKRIK